MTALLNFVPIALAILCYVLAGVFKADPGSHDGLLVLAGSLAGWSVPRLGDMFRREKLVPPSPNTPVVCLLVLGSLLLAGPALGQAKAPQALGCLDAASTYCVVPAAAIGWQVNLKTGDVGNGAALFGLALQHTVGSLPLGLGVYGGLGASRSNQGSYQACGGLSITHWGLLCLGAQRAELVDGATAWQGMLTFAGQLAFGGTPSYVREAAP